MSDYFFRPVAGNNANDGLSFANAKKNLVGFSPAGGGGHRLKIEKSPDPTSLGINATFTNLSATVTLASALTANISTCDTTWTGATNVTATTVSSANNYKEGSAAANFAIAAGFTTGKIAYQALGSTTDFSAYQQISFWIQFSSVSAANSSTYTIRLCSDATGDTPVDTFALPAGLTAGVYHAVTIDKGSALGSSIASISIAVSVDPNAITVRLDNVLACKASASADSLTLNSFIGKNVAGDTFYPIQSINGTTVIIGGVSSLTSGSANLRGYIGTTETVTAYKREAWLLTSNGSQTVSGWGEITFSGVAGSPNTISGGWDPADNMVSQNGETWFDQCSNNNIGFRVNAQSYLSFEKVSAHRFYLGFYFTDCNNITMTNCWGHGNFVYGVQCDGVCGDFTFTNLRFDLNGNYGMLSPSNSVGSSLQFHGNIVTGLWFAGFSGNNVFNTVSIKNGSALGIDYYYNSNNIIYNLVTSNNGTAALQNYNGFNYLVNASIAESTEVQYGGNFARGRVFSLKHDQTADNHLIFVDGGLISSDTANRDTASGLAWKVDITSANRNSSYPIRIGGGGDPTGIKVACVANSQVTVSVRVKRTNTNLAAVLMCRGGQLSGIPNDVSASASGSANVYETLTIQFTPTEAGVVDVEMQAYTTNGVTTYSCYWDNATISQA